MKGSNGRVMALLHVNELQECVEEHDDCQRDAAECTRASPDLLVAAKIKGRN